MDFEIIIGIEIHAELATESKIFCGCSTKFGAEPNTQCCPICLGMPGTLPLLNKKAVEYAIKAGLAMNCEISRFSKQDRKNYFYPDLPKAYQISQYDLPLCKNGYVEIHQGKKSKNIGITRIHIEEDAGKLIHDASESSTLIDYNRCGVPLIEIVSEPDMRSPEEARAFVEAVRDILLYLKVSDCRMQEGSLRADINLSVRPAGSNVLGTRTEMKNLNSFRAIQRAAEYEAKRQIRILENGGKVEQETRRWDDSAGVCLPMRSKEDAQDYRYFPEPDLVPIIVSDEWLENIRASLPELPDARKKRYITDYGLPEHDAWLITSTRELSDFFEAAVKTTSNIKAVSNWIIGDIMRIINERQLETSEIPFPAEYLASLVELIDKGIINNTTAKKVLEEMFNSGKAPYIIVKENNLEQVDDTKAIALAVQKVISANPGTVEEYKKGKEKLLGFLVGQVMKEMNGRANPQTVKNILKQKIDF